jgi:hypothetical protein
MSGLVHTELGMQGALGCNHVACPEKAVRVSTAGDNFLDGRRYFSS